MEAQALVNIKCINSTNLSFWFSTLFAIRPYVEKGKEYKQTCHLPNLSSTADIVLHFNLVLWP